MKSKNYLGEFEIKKGILTGVFSIEEKSLLMLLTKNNSNYS